ncbi:MAG: hypothetical protein C0478_01550 [Planctomyces sp.]|nr:hypothetical protein [Planctomyces sp.]
MIMVAFAIEDTPVDLGTSAQIVARCHVADYLRDAGIRHPDLLSSLSRRFVEEAGHLLEDTQPTGGDVEPEAFTAAELCEAALRLAMRELESAAEASLGLPKSASMGKNGIRTSIAVDQVATAQNGEPLSHSSESAINGATDGLSAGIGLEVVPGTPSRMAEHRLKAAGQRLEMMSMSRIHPDDVAPPSQRTAMHAQLRPRLIRFFRKGYWRTLWRSTCKTVATWRVTLEPVR